MTERSTAFFEQMRTHPHPVLHNVRATLRVDLTDRTGVTHWYLDIDRGKIDVSHRAASANAVVCVDRELFDRLLRGGANAFAATLRGQVRIEGDPSLLVALQSVLPGPADRYSSVILPANENR